MNCTPTYISKALKNVPEANLENPELTKSKLEEKFTNLHLSLAREALKEDEIFKANNAVDPVTKEFLGGRIFAGNEGSSRNKLAKEWIDTQNKKEGREIFSIVKDPNYPDYDSRYLKLNLLPLIEQDLEKVGIEATLLEVDNTSDLTIYSLNKSGFLETIDYVNKFEATVQQIEEQGNKDFERTVSNFVDKLKEEVVPNMKKGVFLKGMTKDELSDLVSRFQRNKENLG